MDQPSEAPLPILVVPMQLLDKVTNPIPPACPWNFHGPFHNNWKIYAIWYYIPLHFTCFCLLASDQVEEEEKEIATEVSQLPFLRTAVKILTP